jgi:hypothetical protein
MQAKSRKWAVKETRTEVHVARASLSPCSDLPIVELFLDLNMQEIFAAACLSTIYQSINHMTIKYK